MTLMKFEKDDTVILNPSASYSDGKDHPIWGGTQGYVLGHIEKVLTHEHDSAKHSARVKWNNGASNAYAQSELMHATGDMVDWSKDYEIDVDPGADIVLLLWTGKDFALGVIEPNYAPGGRLLWSLFLSRIPIGVSESQSDWNLFNVFLSAKDLTETTHETLFEAMAAFHEFWGLPSFRALPMPLTELRNIRHALDRTTLKQDEPQLARFTLINRLMTYVAESPSAGS